MKYPMKAHQIDNEREWECRLSQMKTMKCILMFWDLESQVRMRYWSICAPGISTISQILERAIMHGVRFAIGIQAKDQYFTLPLLVQWTPSDPTISDRLSGQSIGSPSESVGHDWIPLLVQPKSSESPLKPPKSKKWLDWLEFCVRWTSAGLPLDWGRNQ